MATHSSTLAWKNPMDGGAWKAVVHGVAESNTTKRLHFHFSLSCTGEGNGNPLQCSCLENSRDGGASWGAVYGVAQSRTRLKRLSSSSISAYILQHAFFTLQSSKFIFLYFSETMKRHNFFLLFSLLMPFLLP